MIPKKLHYCWFGNNPKSKVFEACLVSWKFYCPDFEIVEWNEINSKKYSNSFYKNALRKKKYAFVADYIRTKVLYEQGGVYLDTDILLLKPIDDLLKYDFFSGEEVINRVAYGFYGAQQYNHIVCKMLQFYNLNYFNGFSPPVITDIFEDFVKNETLKNNEIIFPSEYFYPLPYQNKEESFTTYITEKTYAVHLWDHSWKTEVITETIASLLQKINIVFVDFIWYQYPYSYFRRYMKEFSRKIYQLLFKRKK